MESYGAGEWGGGLCHAVVLWGRRGGRGLTHGENQAAPLSTHPPTPIFSCPEWWSQTLVPQNFHTVMQMICIVFVNTLSFSTSDGPHYQCHQLLWQRNPPFEKVPPQSHHVASHAWHKWWFCAIASENHWYWARTRSKTLKLGNSWMDCIDGAVGGERGKCIKWDAHRRMHGTAITPRLPILLHSSICNAMQSEVDIARYCSGLCAMLGCYDTWATG